MKITVLGLWHLGSVTAACGSTHFSVVGLDEDKARVEALNQGKAPLFEPGLDARLAENIAAGRLKFTTDEAAACAGADLLWLTCDTPVDEHDVSDVGSVMVSLRRALAHLPAGALVLVSSQLPMGTCAGLEREFPQFHFACSPENLRLGRALDAFEKAERVVVGVRSEEKKALIDELFAPFTSRILFMRTESAEMVKHALNSFLALSVSYINEIGRLCEHAGADAAEVSSGLKSDPRIGPRAYLGAGGAFAGGTLARDVVSLSGLGEKFGETLELIPAIKVSNDFHRGWIFRKIRSRFGNLEGCKFAVLGLTYTPNTDTLRRSAAVELCHELLGAGAHVLAFDPAVRTLPEDLAAVQLADLETVLEGASAAIVCTEWPQFRQADWASLLPRLHQRVVIDPNRFLDQQLREFSHLEHLSVGRPS